MQLYCFLVMAALLGVSGSMPVTAQEETGPYLRYSGKALKVDRAPHLNELKKRSVTTQFVAGHEYTVPNILIPLRLQGVKNVDVLRPATAHSPIIGQAPSASLSFEGYDSDDNVIAVGSRIAPPDTEGDVGLDHYVQYNNLGFEIFDKYTGVKQAGPFPGNVFWSDFGGVCETGNYGDPIVLYDHIAGRWLFSQFEVSGNSVQCVAISDGEDPMGPYTRFAFSTSQIGIGDYPKIGIWTTADGSQSAYHITMNEFDSGFTGVILMALNRDAMLAAVDDATPDTPGYVQFFIPPASGSNPFAFTLQPGHLEGPALPTAGTCETYLQAFDSETWGAAGGTDGYRTWKFCVDFATPANSTLIENPLIPAGFEFDSNLCGYGSCISQPSTTQRLDPLGQHTMYRFAVRDVNGSLSGVISHTVDLGSDVAGIQWARFDMSGASPVLADTGLYDVGDGDHRWMPSISQDAVGNLGIGYSKSSADTFPSVYFTGRESTDPAGSLQAESVCIDGTGSQSGTSRWGDYSTVSIDPEDDCTFFVTNQFVETTGRWEWDTQICTFSYDSCFFGTGVPSCSIDNPSDDVVITVGDSINYSGTAIDSDDTIVDHAWTFEGGDPASASIEDPGEVSYGETGNFLTTFSATDNSGKTCKTASIKITVIEPETFTIGGSVSDLTGTGLVLQNNASDDLAIDADGSFTFDTPLIDGTDYWVTVKTQPAGPNQICSVDDGSGTLSGADVTNVNVTCRNPCNLNTVSGVTEDSNAVHEACDTLVVGPSFIAQDGASVSLSGGREIRLVPDFSVEQGATLDANVCGQSLCETSTSPMPRGCHSCVDKICAVDSFCCDSAFDRLCLLSLDTACNLVCE